MFQLKYKSLSSSMKINKKHFAVLSLIIILIGFTKCTADKRIYTKGYHIAWHNTKSQNKTVSTSIKTENVNYINDFKILDNEPEEQLFASSDNSYQPQTKKVFKEKTQLPNDSCGDIIILKNGEEISGKVFEINQKTIKHKKCNNLNGPLFVVPIESVFMIKYANGTKEVIKQTESEQTQTQSKEINQNTPQPSIEKQWNGCAIASLVCMGLFFLIIPLLAAAILSIIAENQFDNNPNKYKGKWMYIPGLVIAWIISIILTLSLIVLMGGIFLI